MLNHSFKMSDLMWCDIGERETRFVFCILRFEVEIFAFIYSVIVGSGLFLKIGIDDSRPFGVVDFYNVDWCWPFSD